MNQRFKNTCKITIFAHSVPPARCKYWLPLSATVRHDAPRFRAIAWGTKLLSKPLFAEGLCPLSPWEIADEGNTKVEAVICKWRQCAVDQTTIKFTTAQHSSVNNCFIIITNTIFMWHRLHQFCLCPHTCISMAKHEHVKYRWDTKKICNLSMTCSEL